jgi:stearoyl-CoA desaturase (delta-9 desaturase)
VGWIVGPDFKETDYKVIGDYAKYPELVWLNKHYLYPPVTLAVLVTALGGIVNGGSILAMFTSAGLSTLFVGFFLSTVILYHATFSINSIMHKFGNQRYQTGDESRNSVWLALLTLGEGWHNNHHHYSNSVRQGFRWWEIDATWYVLKLLEWIGLVHDLKTPPERVLRNEHRLGMRTIQRTAEQLAMRFDPERIAHAIAANLHPPELSALRQALAQARHSVDEALAGMHLPHMPTRTELMTQAKAMFAKTPSLDRIVERSRELLLASMDRHLAAPRLPASTLSG